MLARLAPLLLAALLAVTAAACSDDEPSATSSTTSSTSSTTAGEGTTSSTALPNSEALVPLLLTGDDLPGGFTASDEVDDTITSFCATHDAAAGLQATERAVVGFSRTGGGASVIELVFRFRPGDAERFLAQAEEALSACSGVPDGSGTGLAFEYEPLPEPVEAALSQVGAGRTGALGTSVGSGSLVVEVAVVQQDDLAVLVAVLGLDEPQEDLDSLAAVAFAAVAERLAPAQGP